MTNELYISIRTCVLHMLDVLEADACVVLEAFSKREANFSSLEIRALKVAYDVTLVGDGLAYGI